MRFGCGVAPKFKLAKFNRLKLKSAAKPNTARTPPNMDSAEFAMIYSLGAPVYWKVYLTENGSHHLPTPVALSA